MTRSLAGRAITLRLLHSSGPCGPGCARRRAGGHREDRLGDLQDRPESPRRRRHHAAELPALGEGRERRRRHHARPASACRSRWSSTTTARKSEEAVRAIERLVTQDKVDFILPPWGTALNLAVGPMLQPRRLSASRRAPRSPTARPSSPSAGRTRSSARHRGADMPRRWSTLLDEAAQRRQDRRQASRWSASPTVRHRAVDRRPRGASRRPASSSSTTRPIRSARRTCSRSSARRRRLSPDIFVAFSYPPDTLGADRAGAHRRLQSEGVLHRRRHRLPAVQAALRRQRRRRDGHRRLERRQRRRSRPTSSATRRSIGREPDRWASPITYASLQVLQQAIERVGKIDRAAVIKEMPRRHASTPSSAR